MVETSATKHEKRQLLILIPLLQAEPPKFISTVTEENAEHVGEVMDIVAGAQKQGVSSNI